MKKITPKKEKEEDNYDYNDNKDDNYNNDYNNEEQNEDNSDNAHTQQKIKFQILILQIMPSGNLIYLILIDILKGHIFQEFYI